MKNKREEERQRRQQIKDQKAIDKRKQNLDKIKPLLEKAHLFALPTEGENFGHAIFEALTVGCPVLISDQTPWAGLRSKKAGIELPLADQTGFTDLIQEFVDMPDTAWQEYRQGAWSLARSYQENLSSADGYHQLFKNAE